MRPALVLILACAAGLSCGGDGGPAALDPSDFRGNWTLENPENPSCVGAAGPTTRHFYVAAEGFANGVFNVVTDWDFVRPFRGLGFTVTGNFNIANRTVELNFWHTTLSVGAMFTGTIEPDGSIRGTLRDPKPGYSPHVVVGSCTWTATGRRVP